MLTVNEIFHSIQGESSRAGQPCVFVRLTACDLRCSWCDTPYAFYEGPKRSLDEVLSNIFAYAYDNDNPSNAFRYLDPPSRTRKSTELQ